MTEALAKARSRNWIFACDWNSHPHHGPLPDFFSLCNGILASASGHLRSTTPTDSVWVSPSLSVSSVSTLQPVSDHYGSRLDLDWEKATGPASRAWEFQRASPLSHDSQTLPEQQGEQLWSQHATDETSWSELRKGTVDAMWVCWTKDAEKYLAESGALQLQSTTCPRGSEPKLRPGGSRRGPGQSLSERQLRRFLRRLAEIQLFTLHGKSPPASLVKACVRGCEFFGFSAEGHSHQGSMCHSGQAEAG